MKTPFHSLWQRTTPAAQIVAAALSLLSLTAEAADTPPTLGIQLAPAPHLVFQWQSRTDAVYRIEFTSRLVPTNWQALSDELAGNGGALRFTNEAASQPQRFYRLLQTPLATISPEATLPMPGVIYPANTLLGVAPLGVQYRIPPAWKGAIRQGTSTMLFGSDTEPGLVLGVLTLAGDAGFITRVLPGQFWTDNFGGYAISQPVAASSNRITGEWTGFGSQQGAIMRLEGVVHPSGGMVGFFGLFTPPNRSVMERTLASLANSTVTVRRLTDQTWVDALRGRAFKWTDYKSTGGGGNSGSLSHWSDNNAFFCNGTYEVTSYYESSYSGSLSGGAFYSGGSSSNSNEAGDWTVIQTPNGPALILLSASGVQAALISLGPSGNTFYFGDQEFSLTGAHTCLSP